MRVTPHLFLILLVFLSGCDLRANKTIVGGVPSPTPFQPGLENAPDSPYSAAAPTPLYLPTVTSLPPMPIDTAVLPESIPADINVPTFIPPASLNPLTGLPASDPSLLERRPLAIKVANYPRYVRPQSGLTLADTVFEYYIEAGLTRFVAVFYCNDSEWVGPVRSGRYFDEHVQRMYHAYLVFKFADPRELTHFEGSDFSQFLVLPTIGSCPPFRLMPSRKIEDYNNSYFNTILWEECILRDGLDNRRQAIRSGFFSDAVQTFDLLGTQMFTYYSVDSYNYWLYEPETKQYVRYQELDDTRNNQPESYDV